MVFRRNRNIKYLFFTNILNGIYLYCHNITLANTLPTLLTVPELMTILTKCNNIINVKSKIRVFMPRNHVMNF